MKATSIGWSENLHPDIPYVDATLHDPGTCSFSAVPQRPDIYVEYIYI